MSIKKLLIFSFAIIFILLGLVRVDVYAQYATPTSGGGPTPTSGGSCGSCAATCTGQNPAPDCTCTGCSSTSCLGDCPSLEDCGSNSGGGCGGRQNCPAPAGECAIVSGGIMIGTCGDSACWTTCCNGNPTTTPAPTTTIAPTPAGCGNGSCGAGESCSNCTSDCGVCPTPPPAGTPVPTAPPGSCPNGTCGAGESCANCPADCGACPTNTPTPTPGGVTNIQSRGVMMNSGDDCTLVRGSTTALPGATLVHSFTNAPTPSPGPQTQSGTNHVLFGPSLAGSYTIAVSGIPQNYVLQKACWITTTPTSGEGISVFISNGQALRWDLGYTLGSGWAQTQGGDVYARSTMNSLVPNGINPRVFNLTASSPGSYPGIVTYGSSYDFDIDSGNGAGLVSSENWLVNESYAATDFYQTFYRRFGSPTTFIHTNPSFATPPSDCPGNVCYVSGLLTVSNNWNIGSGSYIFIVDGDLALNARVNLTGTGFVAFIVKNNITVSSSVGGLYSSSAPQVEGIYITGPGGTFSTGTSVIGTERFVGKGIFVAGNFNLQRDLAIVNRNTTIASEQFIYNPRLLVTMPDTMRDLPITWEEVAP